MCLLVVNKNPGGVTRNHFENAWSNNPDGFGMAFAHEGVIHTYKNLESAEESYGVYAGLREKHKGAFILHFRLATEGTVDEKNCHPFEIRKDLVFAHNGIISITPKPGASDTSAFRDLLRELPKNFLQVPALVDLIQLATIGSKLAFLTASGAYKILGERSGEWTPSGDWFSNRTHLHSARLWVGKTHRWYREMERGDFEYYSRCTLCDRYSDDILYDGEDPVCRQCHAFLGITWTREETIHSKLTLPTV
jgi:hypothetical protein